MGRKIFEMLEAIIVYSFIGISFAMAWISNKHYPLWLALTLLWGSLVTLNVINKYFKNSSLKLLGKLDIRIIGYIAYFCFGSLIFIIFY